MTLRPKKGPFSRLSLSAAIDQPDPFDEEGQKPLCIDLHGHVGVGLDPVDAGHLEAVSLDLVALDHVVAIADRLAAGELTAWSRRRRACTW